MPDWNPKDDTFLSEEFYKTLHVPEQPANPKVVRVAMVGLPNAGKSTLMNALVGTNVSATSPKVQTTRERILGILTERETQVLFFDTPGVISYQEGRRLRLARPLIMEARNSMLEADVVVSIVDATRLTQHFANLDLLDVPEGINKDRQSHVMVLNKMDLLGGEAQAADAFNAQLGRCIDRLGRQETVGAGASFDAIMRVSALQGAGVAELKDHVLACAVEGMWLYDKELTTDQSVMKQIEERVREQLFLSLHRELPYKLFQRNITLQEREDGSLEVCQAIVAQQRSQKVIIIGKGGERIARMQQDAEDAIAKALQRPVQLQLVVLVANKRDRRRYL